MPSGPLAHISLIVKDLDKAIEDWTKILEILDPAQLEERIVRYDEFEGGEDRMRWATFVNPGGSEIQLMEPDPDSPLGRRLEKRGEHVHHICFTAPDLPDAVGRLEQNGIKLTSSELQNDPKVPWQHWTFISPESSHGTLVELAYPYRPVDGAWEPGEGAPSAA